MPVMFHIELRPAEESRHELELRLARVRKPMAKTVHGQKRRTGRISFHKVVEGVHQAANTLCSPQCIVC